MSQPRDSADFPQSQPRYSADFPQSQPCYSADFPQPPLKRMRLTDDDSSEIVEPVTVEQIESEQYDFTQDKYDDFVNPAEVEKLKEFRVLDEIKSNDEDSNGEDDDSDDSSVESELPEEEIEKMLEADLPDGFKVPPKPKEKAYVTREKIVLEEKGVNHFDILPLDWIEIRHQNGKPIYVHRTTRVCTVSKPYFYIQNLTVTEKGVNHFEILPLDWIMIRHQSGMPVYVHRTSRVCTLSKPYFLGKGNAKRHDIPLSAVPCLAYRRALEEEERQKLIDDKIEEQIKRGNYNGSDQTNTPQTSNLSINNDVPQEKAPEIDSKSEQDETKTLEESASGPSDRTPLEIASLSVANACPYINKRLNSTDGGVMLVNNNENVEKNTICKLNSLKMEEENGEKSNHMDLSVNEDVTPSTSGDLNRTEMINLNESVTNTILEGGNGLNENPSTSTDFVEIPLNRQPVVLPGGVVMPSPRVETVTTCWEAQHLTHEQLFNYCKTLFKFKMLNIMHFKRWADRRKYTKARKALQYPMLPEGTKLITIPVQSTSQDASGKPVKRDWVMNMNGRSYLSVFHEYVRRALQKQPVYEFKQLENATTPYQATVLIGGMQYGVGYGTSKRQAKSAAARASIQILIPEMKEHLDADIDANPDFGFFDYVGIEDPRISEFCVATCEPTPHSILRTCLLRNFGAGDRQISTSIKKLEYQKIELTMKVGKHSATVVCKNKKTAKQRAAQALLQGLHPHVRSWGSLLRLYGSRSVKSCKEKKLEEQQITLLQDKARQNEPNHAVLEKLRHEMQKLRERDEAVVPLGNLLFTEDLPSHSGSNLNNVDL